MPEPVDLDQHGIARVAAEPFGEDARLSVGLDDAFEGLAVLARGKADVDPVAVGHVVQALVANDVRGLQAAGALTQFGFGLHGDAHRLPVRVGQVLAFPAVEQPRVPAAPRLANARPQLPRAVRRLPHAEVDRLLSLSRVLAQIGITGDLPPVCRRSQE